jgi:hypothetical protein
MDKKSRDKSTRSRKDLSNTLDLYNVDFAKKAVGNLFDKEDDEDIIEEEEPDFSPPPKRRPVRGFNDDADIPDRGVRKVRPIIRDEPKEALDTPPDDGVGDDEFEELKLVRAKPPLQKPQVSSAIPGPQRRPRLSRVADEEDDEEEAAEVSPNTSPGRPRARPAGSRYVFVEDEDRFSSFRRKPDILEKEKSTSKDKDETGKGGRQKPAKELKRDRPLFDGGYVEPGSPDIIKIASMGVAGVALVIIIILLIGNGSLRNQVGEAEGLQVENTRLQDELNLIRIELEGAVESLSNAQLQLQQQQQQDELPQMELPEGEFGEEAGSMALADAVRTHTVVAGDSLSRIANTFFGDSSQANIQRIMDANNLTNSNIHVGQVLDIPN